MIIALLVVIGLLACLLLTNLVWTVTSLDSSIIYLVSASIDNNASELIKDFKDSWAIRGQIGDVLSGHFSALAFLAVAFSVIIQNEANKQTRESIKKQEERSFIENMNNRLNRYYDILDKKILEVVEFQTGLIPKIGRVSTRQTIPFTAIKHYSTDEFIDSLNFIYDEIESIKEEHETAYNGFLRELTLRLISNDMVKQMSKNKPLQNKCKAFSLLKE